MRPYIDNNNSRELFNIHSAKNINTSRPISANKKNEPTHSIFQSNSKSNPLYLQQNNFKNLNACNFFNRLKSAQNQRERMDEDSFEDYLQFQTPHDKMPRKFKMVKSEKRDKDFQLQNIVIKNFDYNPQINIHSQLDDSKDSLIKILKNQNKELKQAFVDKDTELQLLKRTLIITSLKEIQIENQTLNEELDRMKTNYGKVFEQNLKLEKIQKEFPILQDKFEKQQVLVNQLQQEIQSLKNIINEINLLNKSTNELLNEDQINEFTYLLLKNFEIRKISFEKLKDSVGIKELACKGSDVGNDPTLQIANKLIVLLKLNNDLDKSNILKYMRSIRKNNENTSDLINKVYSLFKDIPIHTDEGDKKMTLKIQKILKLHKMDLNSAFLSYDSKGSGLINLNNFKEMLKTLNINMKRNQIEFIMYLMKKPNDESSHLDLDVFQYSNIIKLLDNTLTEDSDDEFTLSIKKDLSFKHENNINQIQIVAENNQQEEILEDNDEEVVLTMKEFNQKVDQILSKLADILVAGKLTVREFFKEHIVNHSISPKESYEAIPLKECITSLQHLGINITTIDIYCIFTKLKYDDEYEMIDVTKLVDEMLNYGIFEENTLTNPNDPEVENDQDISTASNKESDSNFIQKLLKYLNRNNKNLDDLLFPISKNIKIVNTAKQGVIKVINKKILQTLFTEIAFISVEIDPKFIESDGQSVNLTSIYQAVGKIKK